MINPVAAFYAGDGSLADVIAESLRKTGKDIAALKAGDHIATRQEPSSSNARVVQHQDE